MKGLLIFLSICTLGLYFSFGLAKHMHSNYNHQQNENYYQRHQTKTTDTLNINSLQTNIISQN